MRYIKPESGNSKAADIDTDNHCVNIENKEELKPMITRIKYGNGKKPLLSQSSR